MNEIDESKCRFLNMNKECRAICNELCIKIKDCYYKQLKQLKEENEDLKSEIRQKKRTIMMNNDHYHNVDIQNRKYKQCIDEIEEIVNYGSVSYNNHKELADFYEDKIEEIIKLIKQAKGCEE